MAVWLELGAHLLSMQRRSQQETPAPIGCPALCGSNECGEGSSGSSAVGGAGGPGLVFAEGAELGKEKRQFLVALGQKALDEMRHEFIRGAERGYEIGYEQGFRQGSHGAMQLPDKYRPGAILSFYMAASDDAILTPLLSI